MTLSLVRPDHLDTAAAHDDVLALRMRDGETAAGEELVRRHGGPLLRYLQRLTGDDHRAEELFQQTWVSVLEHLEKFKPASPPAALSGGASSATAGQASVAPMAAGGNSGFKAWLYRIATNKANDQWRSRGRERVAKEGLRLVVEEQTPDASVGLTGAEEAAKLKRAIAQLPEAQRQVVMMRYYGGLKFVEIAETLGCPLNTALGRMHKATVKLRELMDA